MYGQANIKLLTICCPS